MFLNQLTEEEKKMYIALAVNASEVNGCVTEEEEACIEDYCREMNIQRDCIRDIPGDPVKRIYDVFSKSSMAHKKIIMFETIAFMYVDGTYDETEEKYVDEFGKMIGFPEEDIARIRIIVEKYVACVTEIAEAIFG